MLRRFSRWSCSRHNGHAMVWPLRFPAEPERRRTGRCWVNPDRRTSDRARREDGRSDARRPSHTGQVNEMKDGLIYSVVEELSEVGPLVALDEMHL